MLTYDVTHAILLRTGLVHNDVWTTVYIIHYVTISKADYNLKMLAEFSVLILLVIVQLKRRNPDNNVALGIHEWRSGLIALYCMVADTRRSLVDP